ncbi:MAG: hypothetical protein JSV65_01060 [Armatimonadota bacterium]|nr:MAG: hypothetical protein JSV65_01060 [Armatimonadota bacterium]
MSRTRAHNRPRSAAGAIRAALLILAGVMLALAASSPAGAAELRLGPTSLSVVGQETVTFRSQEVSGSELSRSSFHWDNYSLSRRFEHRTDLVVRGDLLPDLRVDAVIARGSYTPGRQRLTFTFDGSDAVVKAGDLAVLFDGGLAGFRRSLRGIQVDSRLARGALTMIASECEPAVRTDVLYGRNSAGPYYLAASPLVDASEVVEVDGRRMQRGADYSIDYQIGLIQFAPTLIISPASRIAVSYEYDAPGGMSGTLVGLRGAYPISSGLRVGATYLTLERRAAAAPTTTAKEDRWLGNNTAGPFTLTFRPIEPGSERVRLDGILQVQGRDYQVDYAIGSIMFLQPVPAGVSVIVTYRVEGAAQSSSPQRSLVGLDAHYAAGAHLNLDAELAHSVGGVGAGGSSGSALAIGARGEWDRLSLAANLHRADAAFAPFESAGRREMRGGYDCTVGFQPATGLRITGAVRNYRRPYFQYGDASGLLVHDRSRELTLDFNRAGWPTLSYVGSWSAVAGEGAASLAERTDSQLLTLGYERRTYGVQATYRSNAHARQGEAPLSPYTPPIYGPQPLEPQAFGTAYAGRGEGTALSMWYRPGTRLSVVCDLARSGMSLAGGGETRADSSRVAVEYVPTSATAITLGYRSSSSGETVSADGRTVPGYTTSGHSFNLRHNAARNLALNLAYDSQMSQGGYSTNSDTDAWTAGFWWQAAGALSFIGQYTRQDLTYLAADGRSANDIMSLGAAIGPLGPGVKLDLNYSHMTGTTSGSFGIPYGTPAAPTGTGGSPYGYGGSAAHGTANSSVRARISYPVAKRQEAFAEWEASSNSGYPGGNRRRALALGWQIGLTRELNFVLDWRQISSESSDTRYSYHARTFGAQLGLKF